MINYYLLFINIIKNIFLKTKMLNKNKFKLLFT